MPDFLNSGTVILLFCVLLALAPLLALLRNAQQGKRRQLAHRAQAQSLYEPKMYVALTEVDRKGCGLEADTPLSLSPGDSVQTFPKAFVFWKLKCNGQTAVDPLASRLLGASDALPKTAADIERIAIHHPEREWLLEYSDPFRRLVYQRQGPGQWNLVHVGSGFC